MPESNRWLGRCNGWWWQQQEEMPRKTRDLGQSWRIPPSLYTMEHSRHRYGGFSATSVASRVQGSTLSGTQSTWSLRDTHSMQGVRKAAPALRVMLTQSHRSIIQKATPPDIRADWKWWVKCMHCIFAPSSINSQVKCCFYNALTSKSKIGVEKISSNGDGRSEWTGGWTLTC